MPRDRYHVYADIPGNEQADQLAKEAVTLPSSEEPTTTYNLRRARESLTTSWTRTWENNSPTQGNWSVANRLRPSLHPPPHFHDLADSREIYGRLTQCRTGHGFHGEYYRRFVPTESTSCPCGEPRQTREHLLQSCPTYEPHRHILREVSDTLYLPDILGSKDGIQALASFLSKSGAFTKNGHAPPSRTTPSILDRPLSDFMDNEPEAPS